VQETSLGEEHQDTVQTLTDLAICHLDQGHNDVGRPLLERALVLQVHSQPHLHLHPAPHTPPPPPAHRTPHPALRTLHPELLTPNANPRLDLAPDPYTLSLALQEAALGPDHADVTAIRDVLQSLDADAEEDE